MKTENYYYKNTKQFNAAVASSNLKETQTTLVQIFASICSPNALKKIITDVKKNFPYAYIIGATTDGEIKETSVSTQLTVVSVTQFEKSTLKLASIPFKVADSGIFTESFTLGENLAKALVSEKTKVVILFTDGLYVNGEDFLKGVEAYAPDVVLAGGMAGDAAHFNNTYVMADSELFAHGVVGVAIDSDVLDVITDYSFNWQGIGRKMRVNKADKNRIYEIDGKSAVAVYRHYLGDAVADRLPAIGIEFPIIVNRDAVPVARAVLNRLNDDSLIFAGNVQVGDEVQLGFGNIDMILESANDIAKKIDFKNIESCFVYSCMARRRFLQDDIQVELKGLSEIAPLAGFFTYGEFYKDKSAQLLNQTMTILALSESEGEGSSLNYEPIEPNEAGDFQLTLKALSHLVNQTSKELDDVNNSLEVTVSEKTLALEEKIKELELATRVKSDFLANMSHEIRTPLNAILGFMQLLGRNETDAMRIKQFATVQSAGNTLVEIINDILDFSKIESGKLKIENIRFLTKKPFQDLSLLFSQKAHDEGVNLEFDFDKALPEYSTGDVLRLKQVLSNLLSNAIKFTPKFGHISVRVAYDDATKSLICSVNDTGRGISKTHQQHIFEAFSQADSSTTREYGGTGLGLSITSKLLELMQGRIELESTLGIGSTFTFFLPLFTNVALEKEDISEHKVEQEPTDIMFEGKALLVEDNKANQMLMKIFLNEMGLEVSVAENGRDAYEICKDKHYDVVLMDENMPVMNGIESTKIIRQLEKENGYKKTPIIAVTANALGGDREKFLAAGMDDYVAKPVDVEILKAILSRYLL